MTELRALAGDIDVEEMLTRAANSNDEDDVEGWVDERQEMSKLEVVELEAVEIHTVNTRERATGRNVLLLAYP
jgi:hypothetical protein